MTVILIILVVSTTIYDYYMEKTGCRLTDAFYKTIVAFSARKNLNDLSKVDKHDRLVILHGIRTVSCLAVIITHRFAAVAAGGTSKNLDYFEDVRS